MGRATLRLRRSIRMRLSRALLHSQRTLVIFKRSGARTLANHADVLLAAGRLWAAGPVVERDGGGHLPRADGAPAGALIGPHGAGMSSAVAMRPVAAVAEVHPEQGPNRLNVFSAALAYTLGLRNYALRPRIRLGRAGGRSHPGPRGPSALARAGPPAQD